MASSSHMVDELEKAFQNSLSLLTSQEYFNIEAETDEIKASVEQSMQRLIDAARQLDTFFMQRRLVLCNSKLQSTSSSSPVKEDLEDLRQELQRKDALIQKHWEKLQIWQNLCKNSSGGQNLSNTGASPGQAQPIQQPQPPPGGGTQQQGPFNPGLLAPTANQAGGYSQGGPLAYLEQTTSSIGLPRIN